MSCLCTTFWKVEGLASLLDLVWHFLVVLVLVMVAMVVVFTTFMVVVGVVFTTSMEAVGVVLIRTTGKPPN